MAELVSQAFQELLAFYQEHCPEARFGEIDLDVLSAVVDSITEASEQVKLAEEAVASARTHRSSVEAELALKVTRVLSFLKIHVEGNSVQTAQLEAIASALGGSRRKSKAADESANVAPEQRTRRPRKRQAATETDIDDAAKPDVSFDAATKSDVNVVAASA